MEEKRQSKTAIAYIYSEDEQTLQQRCEAVRSRARLLNAKVIYEYIDCGYQGKALERPGLTELLRSHFVPFYRAGIDYVIAADFESILD
jgi:hypothetical protein